MHRSAVCAIVDTTTWRWCIVRIAGLRTSRWRVGKTSITAPRAASRSASASGAPRAAPAHGAGAGLGGARGATTPTRGGPAPPERGRDLSRRISCAAAYGVAMKFQVLDVAAVEVGAPAPYWLT